MVTIEVELLSGRYHAHIWGEAQFGMAGPEWPPSPWRLLRALASAWFSARPHPFSETERDALLEALGRAEPPELWLPRTSFHEIRYYQPVRAGGADRVLHHDFFAIPEGGRFWFCFDTQITDHQRSLLERLLNALPYFGRSESRARLRVVDQTEPPSEVRRVAPRNARESGNDVVYRRVLCTAPDFRASDLWVVRDGATPAGGYTPHLVDVLLTRRMPLPCGASWVDYAVPGEILVREIPQRKPSEPDEHVNVAEIHFRLCRRIPIPLQSLIIVAHAFRDAAAYRYRRRIGIDSPKLTGREPDGSISQGHRHVFYLPHLSRKGTIESLVVRVPTGGLTRAELDSLLGVYHIQVVDSPYPISVIPQEVIAELEPPRPATHWVSMTPFLPPLRWQPQQHKTNVETQVAVCAERVSGRYPTSVCRSNGPASFGRLSPLFAHQYFSNDSRPSGRGWTFARRLGLWLELSFEEPVVLDIPLGADAHFGAGQFKPC